MPALGSFSGNFSCAASGKLNAAGVYGGGTTSTTGTSIVYIFTTTSTIKVFTTSNSLTVELLAVGAGGAGRAVNGPYGGGGGGGIAYRSAATLTNGTYLVSPGRGVRGASGGNTYFGNSSFSLTALGGGYGGSGLASAGGAGADEFTTAGTYSWTAPTGVTSVCVVCVGGGGGGGYTWSSGGGGGGGLGWKNNITVVPGQSYSVVVGSGGPSTSNAQDAGAAGGNSYFIDLGTVAGYGGGQGGPNSSGNTGGYGGGYTGDGGGRGGNGAYNGAWNYGGGGAGGYSGNGADNLGGYLTGYAPASGSGGGGATGYYSSTYGVPAGGGVGIYGRGADGSGGSYYGGTGGSGGAQGTGGEGSGQSSLRGIAGGAFGGGGGGSGTSYGGGPGGRGAVRIVWGAGRSFPITNVGAGAIGADGGSGGGGTNLSAGGATLQAASTSGGFGGAGTTSPSSTLGGVGGGGGGSGADGKSYNITGFATLYGGGGGSGRTRGNGAAGTAGTGGGGLGGGDTSSSTDGTDGLGGGGGGGYNNGVISSGYTRGGNGVVILRYSQSTGAGGPVIVYPYTSPIVISSPRGQAGPQDSSPNGGQSAAEFNNYFNNTSQSAMSTAINDGTNVAVPGAAGYLFFTIPEAGTWSIYAIGGSGGYTNKPSKAGSAVGGDFVFASGDVIWISIGGLGAYGNSGGSDLAGGAGGGMTVVARSSSKSKTFVSGDMTPLLCAAGGLGQTEGRHGAYAADSNASDGAGGSGFYGSWLSQSFNGSGAGYGGQTTYGGFGGGTGTDDGYGGAGGYDGLFSGGPNSYVSPTASNVVRYNADPLRGAYNQGYVRLTKL